MASACINNVGVSPENFVDRSPAKYKSSYSLDPEVSVNEMVDFEFRLEHPVNMLPADELFSGGKLMPLQLPTIRPVATTSTSPGVSSLDTHKLRTDVSTKAPRCCSRWKELLGLKKLPPHQDKHEAPRNWKNLLINRSSKPDDDDDSSLNLPLLNKDTSTHDHCYNNNECISISSSRLSLSSSSSSSHEHDDLPRLSLDSDKPNSISNPNPPRIRLVKHRSSALSSENPKLPADSTSTLPWGLSIDDSPRMNSSGKIIFHNLGRSASSPSSFNTRYKHGGSVERSYSANVRVTPVLNVPVCRRSSKSGVFGFPHFSSSSQQKKDATVSVNKKHHSSSRPNKTDRIKESKNGQNPT